MSRTEIDDSARTRDKRIPFVMPIMASSSVVLFFCFVIASNNWNLMIISATAILSNKFTTQLMLMNPDDNA